MVCSTSMSLTKLATAILTVLLTAESQGQSRFRAADLDAYLQPYVRSGNFSGDVLVEKSGKIIFTKAYGFADREHRVRNVPATRFHVASMSMQFTAAVVLRLVETGSIKLDDHVGEFIQGIPGDVRIEGDASGNPSNPE